MMQETEFNEQGVLIWKESGEPVSLVEAHEMIAKSIAETHLPPAAHSDLAVEETNLPRYVVFRGKKARVIGYSAKTETRTARFEIIDSRDQRRSVSRHQITFIKEKK